MADIRPKLDKLGSLLSDGKQNAIDLTEFMQQASSLFEDCKECLDEGSAREKDEMLKELTSLQQTLDSDVESLSKETGKNFEEMLIFVENPDNFPTEAWRIMQKTWREILKVGSRKKR
jgi:predicted nuclease with TOPRIM domain